jgi:hypothetical protein
MTITLASLANNTVAVSSAFNNSATRHQSADFQLTIKTGPSGVSAGGQVCMMFLKSSDGGVTFDDADESNAMILTSFVANQNATTYKVSADTVINGGQLAEFFKIAVLNETGAAFDSNPANFSLKFLGKHIMTTP